MNHELAPADIIVVGGGMSGVISALAAADQGSRVVIIERGSCLGGTFTAGMLGEMNAVYHKGRCVVPDTGRKIVEELISRGVGEVHPALPMTSNPRIKVDRLAYDSEVLKLILDEAVQASGVRVYFQTEAVQLERIGQQRLSVRLSNGYERSTITGTNLIDATGNAECFRLLGGRTVKNPKERCQPVTLMFRLGHVDIEEFRKLSPEEIQHLMLEGFSSGALPARILSLTAIPGTDEVAVNATRSIHVDHESGEDVSAALMETRQQVRMISSYLKEHARGFRDSFLSSIGSQLGIRDRRRIEGICELTGKDLLSGRRSEDAVALGTYPVDIHNSETRSVDFHEIPGDGRYYIPYGCLVSEEFDNVIASGKCLSADDTAYGAVRVMGPLMNIAEAAGTAASLAARRRISLKQVDVPELQAILRSRGMEV